VGALRDSKISLPGREQGYARILIAGTTGARKTTLLPHIIGSSHKSDRFPSTSTARTTIADTEVVTYGGPVEAAITFMSQFEVRAHIDECIEIRRAASFGIDVGLCVLGDGFWIAARGRDRRIYGESAPPISS
jgi:hypothetical protein